MIKCVVIDDEQPARELIAIHLSGLPGWRCIVPFSGGASWTPTLTASSGGLNIGASGSVGGFYFEMGDLVIARGYVSLAGASVAIGTGTLECTLPVTSALSAGTIGRGHFNRSTAPVSTADFFGQARLTATTKFTLTGDLGDLTNTTAPFNSGATNKLRFEIAYRR